MTFLRRYERTAQQQHYCDNCCQFIEPGEQYEGIVQVTSQPKRIVVFKQHTHPVCELPLNPEDEDRKREIGTSDLEENIKKIGFSQAA